MIVNLNQMPFKMNKRYSKNSPLVQLTGKILLLIVLCFCFPTLVNGQRNITSIVQTVDVITGQLDTVLRVTKHLEAPNWHPDNYLILNSGGKIYKLDLSLKQMAVIPTAFADECNNDHGISPDGKWLAISHNDTKHPSTKSYKSAIYRVPIGGGEPIAITTEVPSYWHGWNPDGQHVVYCAERNGNFDIYSISINSGAEKRLTTDPGLDDGPEYSPDGKYIYFNSYRSGQMQIWRMLAIGETPEQLTFDKYSNWFPHLSSDHKSLIYIAYVADQKDQHPFGQDVKLRLLDLKTKVIKDITPVFFGGQGTINVPSWSPDNRKVAFISYEVKP
ncbi:TolB family protein [Pedobacter sp.]|uniref:TolB family protein n=1 Tax=Pedobacter sp. TaxID=1411316 RepID=UPI003D7F7752